MTEVKATISNGYRWRLVLITVMLLGFGALCFYDWQVRWPLKVEQYQAHVQLQEEYPKTYPAEWKKLAAERGWSAKVPTRKTATDVRTQLLMGLIVTPIGLFFLFKLVKELRRWVAMDEAGLTANGGLRVPWDRMDRLDESRWKSKGIAWLHYRGDHGEKRLLLDDFKAERDPIRTIVDAVRNRLTPEPVAAEAASTEGAPTEAEPAEAAQTPAPAANTE
ncbi:MAG: hypothetical protein AAGG38_13165 [Planctomycetota bacterium]